MRAARAAPWRGPAGLPAVVGIAVTVLDLVSSLHTLRQVDARHLAVLGHSQGGGVALLLLVQGTADEQIPAAWTTATYRALRRAGVTTRLVWIPGAPHIMAGADLAAENAAAEAWIRQALGSGASGAAAPRRRSGA